MWQKENVNEDHMLCSFFWGGGGGGGGEWGLLVKDPALELWISLITQQRDDG